MPARVTTGPNRGGLLLVAVAAALTLLAAHSGLPDRLPALTWPPAAGGGDGVGQVVDPLPEGRVSSGFGQRAGGMHYGLDIAAPLGTPIRAIADGTVIEAGPASGFGLWIRIRHHDSNTSGGTVSVYGHMNTITTPAGTHVTAGQQIATVGARGQATGPHLHLEIWPHGDRAARVDPARWLDTHGVTRIGGAP